MVTIQIDTDAVSRYATKLEIFSEALPGVTWMTMKTGLKAGVDYVKTYPAKPIRRNSYERTGEYGEKTTLVSPPTAGKTQRFEILSAAVEAKRGRRYSSYVGGTAVGGPGAFQVIRYGWKNIYNEIVRVRLPKMIGDVDKAIQQKAKESGVI